METLISNGKSKTFQPEIIIPLSFKFGDMFSSENENMAKLACICKTSGGHKLSPTQPRGEILNKAAAQLSVGA